jgi:hypothetical protein
LCDRCVWAKWNPSSCGNGACEALSERSALSLVFPICTQGGLSKGQSSLLESSMEYLYTSSEGRCSYAIGRPVIELEICLTLSGVH